MSRVSSLPVGANAGRSRLHNRQLVLGRLRAAGAAGRARLARESGLTIQAVSNIIAELESDGLVAATGVRSGGRGLPAALYALNPEGGYALGYELRPDAIFAALLRLDGTCLFSVRESLASASPEAALAKATALKARALAATGTEESRLLGAGVVMPGPFERTGISGMGSELPGWQGQDAAERFGAALRLPVTVENDANAAAIAERIAGAARELQNYAFVYFGAGVGLGIVSGGQLMRGAFGNAGEIGHISVAGPAGPCLLESLASRLSLARHMQAAGVRIADSGDLARVHAEGSEPLKHWLHGAADGLAQALLMIENLLDPETVILGGAMPDAILDDLIARVPMPRQSVSNRPNRLQPRLVRGGSGRMTATLGAASLVLNTAFTPQIAAAAE